MIKNRRIGPCIKCGNVIKPEITESGRRDGTFMVTWKCHECIIYRDSEIEEYLFRRKKVRFITHKDRKEMLKEGDVSADVF